VQSLPADEKQAILLKQRSLVEVMQHAKDPAEKNRMMAELQRVTKNLLDEAKAKGFTGEKVLRAMMEQEMEQQQGGGHGGHGEPSVREVSGDLRFPVGARVECRVSMEDWVPGRVVSHWYSESDWEEGKVVPYQIKLDDGEHIMAPMDSPMCIRAEGGKKVEVQLRFAAGDRVKCKVSQEEWVSGKIMKLWHRESHWPEGTKVPYQVKLDNGNLIFAPMDDERCIVAEGAGGKKKGKKGKRK